MRASSLSMKKRSCHLISAVLFDPSSRSLKNTAKRIGRIESNSYGANQVSPKTIISTAANPRFMARWKKALLTAAMVIACIVLLPWLAVTSMDAIEDLHRVDAQALEQDMRQSLPLGTSRSTVESYLTKKELSHNFYPSCEVESAAPPGIGEITICSTERAKARDVKGSSWLIKKSVQFRFRFDEDMKLTSIDSKVYFTGP
jgi:hypothetical protein